jgi:ABC-type cobalamin/Fe3+-siderophores transport system ATPase subunit
MAKYKLPDQNGLPAEYNTESNSLIIIGANGSGKSKLGAWIERQNMENVHRVGAQRSLNFNEYIQLKSYEQAENLLLYGRETKELSKNGRWSWNNSNTQNFTTQLLNDYEDVLAALIAMKNNQNDAFIKECRERDIRGEQYNKAPETVVDTLKNMWKNVFPQRDVDFDDAKVTAVLNRQDAQSLSYKGKEMSDGERVGLYLIAQCLCIPPDKTIIIDEPEIHLHRSIMNRLWTEIENNRKDCFFIYITHDTQFAANRRQANKIWVKSYDGKIWNWEEIQESSLPEQLLLDIIGNRKKVLFVEGSAGSYDTKLYSEIYKSYYVVPCGSCATVIFQTKAMKNTPQLHELECYGIIDRDYRSDYEIDSYKKCGIFTLQVAEVENLFLVEELLKVVNANQGFIDEENVEKIKNYIINDRFTQEINRQILETVVGEIKYKLMTTTISAKNEEEAKQSLESINDTISYETIQTEQKEKFNSILETKDYKKILMVFNKKSLVNSAGHFFDLKDNEYCNLVLRLLQGEKAEDIKNAILPYLPSEIVIDA